MAVSVSSLRVASLIEGAPKETDFEVRADGVRLSLDNRSLGRDEVVAVPEFISVDPYLRSRMAHWPKGFVGLSGTVLRVVSTGDNLKMDKGTLIAGLFKWKTGHLLKISTLIDKAKKGEIQIVSKEEASSLLANGLSSSALLGVLGLTGKTAYYGLLGVGGLKSTDNVLISGAAGATGSVCGQIAKKVGCPLVIGTAGSDTKCKWLSEIGFDGAMNYKSWKKGDYQAIQRDLRKAFPNGIDLYFDNTGGDLTTAVFDLLNKNARVVICGQIAYYNLFKNGSEFSSLIMPLTPDFLFKTIYTSVRVEGFVVSDCSDWTAFYEEMPKWIKGGSIVNRETVVSGFDRIPQAFLGLFSGTNTGKMVCDVRSSFIQSKL